MMRKFGLLRAVVRPTLQRVYRHEAANGSHAAAQESPATPFDSAKRDLIRCLENQGVPSGDCEDIVSRLPGRHVGQSEIDRTLNALNSLQFGQERLVHLLKTHPGLILTSSDQISKCYVNLSSIFSQNYVYKVLCNSPSVVEQRRSEIAEKINYLNKTLRIPNSHIVNSSALSHPLAHIKVRAECLRRCGIYKTATKKDEVVTVVDISDMFDTDDVQFATKVAKLAPVEYEAFKTLYSMEVDSESEWESDSDSD